MSEPLRLATALLHADDDACTEANVAPSISVSTSTLLLRLLECSLEFSTLFGYSI